MPDNDKSNDPAAPDPAGKAEGAAAQREANDEAQVDEDTAAAAERIVAQGDTNVSPDPSQGGRILVPPSESPAEEDVDPEVAAALHIDAPAATQPASTPVTAGLATPTGEPQPAEPPQSPAEAAAAFDPASETVADVNDYLASASPEEQQRVLDAETSGKNRAGIVDGPYAGS